VAKIVDLFDLEGFVDAQAPVYEQLRREMAAGRKHVARGRRRAARTIRK
jgi:uncharacterized protein (DUF1810 family)